MPSAELFVALVLAASVFAFMPGPAMLYAAAQTLGRGRRAGWLAALGIHVGGYAHVVAASFGLAVLFALVPILYLTLKIAGAAYLIFLGIRLFRARSDAGAAALELGLKSPRRAFWESVTVEVLNPKTAIFYVAFLPQFTDPGAAFPIWLQFFILGAIVNSIFSCADLLCVLLADRVATFMRRSRSAGHLVQRLGGTILVALGLNLAFSHH